MQTGEMNWVSSEALESQPKGRVGFRKKLNLKHLRAVVEMAMFSVVDFKDDPQEALDAFARIGAVMSQVVLAWNWVDEDGAPLDQPKNNPGVFEELTFEELAWLIENIGQQVGTKN